MEAMSTSLDGGLARSLDEETNPGGIEAMQADNGLSNSGATERILEAMNNGDWSRFLEDEPGVDMQLINPPTPSQGEPQYPPQQVPLQGPFLPHILPFDVHNASLDVVSMMRDLQVGSSFEAQQPTTDMLQPPPSAFNPQSFLPAENHFTSPNQDFITPYYSPPPTFTTTTSPYYTPPQTFATTTTITTAQPSLQIIPPTKGAQSKTKPQASNSSKKRGRHQNKQPTRQRTRADKEEEEEESEEENDLVMDDDYQDEGSQAPDDQLALLKQCTFQGAPFFFFSYRGTGPSYTLSLPTCLEDVPIRFIILDRKVHQQEESAPTTQKKTKLAARGKDKKHDAGEKEKKAGPKIDEATRKMIVDDLHQPGIDAVVFYHTNLAVQQEEFADGELHFSRSGRRIQFRAAHLEGSAMRIFSFRFIVLAPSIPNLKFSIDTHPGIVYTHKTTQHIPGLQKLILGAYEKAPMIHTEEVVKFFGMLAPPGYDPEAFKSFPMPEGYTFSNGATLSKTLQWFYNTCEILRPFTPKEVIDNIEPTCNQLFQLGWMHGFLTRAACNKLLQTCPEGTMLLRLGSHGLVISIRGVDGTEPDNVEVLPPTPSGIVSMFPQRTGTVVLRRDHQLASVEDLKALLPIPKPRKGYLLPSDVGHLKTGDNTAVVKEEGMEKLPKKKAHKEEEEKKKPKKTRKEKRSNFLG